MNELLRTQIAASILSGMMASGKIIGDSNQLTTYAVELTDALIKKLEIKVSPNQSDEDEYNG